MRNLNFRIVALTLAIVFQIGCVKGETGPAGPAGAGGKISSTLNCSGTITGLGGAASALNGLEVTYDAVLMTNGDVYATASISDEFAQDSSTSFYSSGQNGAATASVYVTADHHGTGDFGYWRVSVNRNTLVTSIVYTDPSLGGQSPVNMTFNAAACSLQNW